MAVQGVPKRPAHHQEAAWNPPSRRTPGSSSIVAGSSPAPRRSARAPLLGHAPAILAQSNKPLKIGLLNSFSKVFAALGNANLNGMQLYFEQIGGTIAGRKIEVIREDDEINPQVGLTKLKKLVESDNCDLVTGIQASNVALACVDYIRQSKTFYLCSGAGVGDLSYTGIPYLFRCSIATHPIHATIGEWLHDNVAKEVVTSASDFAGGRNTISEFKAGFLKKGGKIVKEIYPPLGNNDFSAYLADMRSIGAPATLNFYAGTDAVRFVKQYDEYGLKAKSKLTRRASWSRATRCPRRARARSAASSVAALHRHAGQSREQEIRRRLSGEVQRFPERLQRVRLPRRPADPCWRCRPWTATRRTRTSSRRRCWR